MSQLPAPHPDPALQQLLADARPRHELPPGFADDVWRRIRAADAAPDVRPWLEWLDAVVSWCLRPRWAIAAFAILLLVGAGLGTVDGRDRARQEALNRYLSSISPWMTLQ